MVADIPKATPATALSGAGAEMTLYAAGTQLDKRASRLELLIGRFVNWIGGTFRALFLILQSRAHQYLC